MKHRLINGGREYLPFAESCITKLKKLGLSYADQSYIVNGVQIRVRIEPGHEYIHIDGNPEQLDYEFFTSQKWFITDRWGTLLTYDYDDAPVGVGSYYQLGSGTSTKDGALFTNEDGFVRPKVSFNSIQTTTSTSKRFKVWEAANNQRLTPNVHWYDNDPNQLVLSCNAWGEGRTWWSWRNEWFYTLASGGNQDAFFTTIPPYKGATGSYTQEYGREHRRVIYPFVYMRPSMYYHVGYLYKTGYITTIVNDVMETRKDTGAEPFVLQEPTEQLDVYPHTYRDGVKLSGNYIDPYIFPAWSQGYTTDYAWRTACITTADDGTEFCVQTDTYGGFTFFKLVPNFESEELITAGVTYRFLHPNSAIWYTSYTAEHVTVVKPNYPAWVHLRELVIETPYATHTTTGEWKWTFNKKGTRAATTPISLAGSKIWVTHTPNHGSIDGRAYGRYTLEWNNGFTPGTTSSGATLCQIYQSKRGVTGLNDPYAWVKLDPHPLSNLYLPLYLNGDQTYLYLDYWMDLGRSSIADNYMGRWIEELREPVPGFMEVSISITAKVDEPGKYDFAVTNLDVEEYKPVSAGGTGQGVYYVDTGYYVRTPRTTPTDEGWNGAGYANFEPEDDDLLTAEIEVKYLDDTYPARSAVSPQLADTANSAIATVWSFNLQISNITVSYVVRRRSDRAEVKRLCLAQAPYFWDMQLNGVEYQQNPARIEDGHDVWDLPKAMYAGIEQSSIRYLTFMTHTHCRRKSTFWYGDAPAGDISDPNINGDAWTVVNGVPITSRKISELRNQKPRFEMRVHGKPLETINYSEPATTGFSAVATDETYGPDPMTTVLPYPGTTDFSTAGGNRWLIPLMLKHYFTHHLIKPTHLDVLAMSPGGSYSIYSDRRGRLPTYVGVDYHYVPEHPEWDDVRSEKAGGFMTIQPDSTVKTGVFDVISTYKKGKGKKAAVTTRTTHKARFNAVFKQRRDYAYYESSNEDDLDYDGFYIGFGLGGDNDWGGFATYGCWVQGE